MQIQHLPQAYPGLWGQNGQNESSRLQAQNVHDVH